MLRESHTRSARHRRGAMMVLIAICLPIIIIIAAFAIDVAWMQLSRTELRTATDSAARAGAKELSLKQDEDAARTKAQAAAARNLVAGEPLLLADADVEIGKSVQVGSGRFEFTPGVAKPNAVRIHGKRTSGSKSGPVDMLFSGVLGVDEFEPAKTATSTQLDRDICLVVDRSGSMMWTLKGGSHYPKGTKACDPPDPTRSRWGALASAVEIFLQELVATDQEEQVALVSYSSNTRECGNRYRISQINADLGTDLDTIRTEMGKISSKPVKGSTSISAGIDDGIDVLTGKRARPFAARTMVVLTDGIHNLGPEPILSAREAAKKDIMIYTITFSDDADIARMKAVAEATGGKHFHANNPDELIAAFKEIAVTLPVLITE